MFLCYSFTLLGQSDVVGAASFTCSTLAENFGKVICGTHELLLRVGSGWLNSKIHVLSTSPEVFDRMPIISAKLSVRVTGADKARKVGASSISEIGPRGLWAVQLLRKRAPLRLIRRTMRHRFLRKQSCWGSGSRRFGEQCLFDFWESNHVGSLALEIRKAVPLRFRSKQSCWECFLECE